MKNSDTAGQKGYDAGKKVSGIKRHIAVDTQGFPHAVAVTTAEVTDRQGALEALKRCRSGLGRVKRLLCDSGYTGDPFAEGVQDILGKHVTVQIAKRSELHTFKVMPKRWSVERSFAWLEKNRRLSCSSSTWRSWHCCSGDREQVLRAVGPAHDRCAIAHMRRSRYMKSRSACPQGRIGRSAGARAATPRSVRGSRRCGFVPHTIARHMTSSGC
ncbi:ISXo3 transposase orfB [Xanthomonas oryzae pv. oryzae MAFF 311018]|nr:ISXo3 transposase orfB [Xanthomonas oryzae pv. oryzae MAFF 311018]